MTGSFLSWQEPQACEHVSVKRKVLLLDITLTFKEAPKDAAVATMSQLQSGPILKPWISLNIFKYPYK